MSDLIDVAYSRRRLSEAGTCHPEDRRFSHGLSKLVFVTVTASVRHEGTSLGSGPPGPSYWDSTHEGLESTSGILPNTAAVWRVRIL